MYLLWKQYLLTVKNWKVKDTHISAQATFPEYSGPAHLPYIFLLQKHTDNMSVLFHCTTSIGFSNIYYYK